MAMRIILKHSSAEDQRPTVAQAGQAGELLLNTHSAGAFLSCKDSAGDIHQVGGVKISTAAPANPVKGTVWLDINLGLDRGLLKVYNGTQWVTGGGTFDACTDGGLVQDSSTGCWSVELSIDDLTDVDTSTNTPAIGEILVWDGTNWVPESLADVQLDWSDLPACTGGGFIYDTSDADPANHCWKIDWSTLPACGGGGFVYDNVNNCWKIDWVTFPGGDHIEWDPTDELWNVIPVPPVEISDTAPDFKAEYFWWNSDTGELFLGYKDPSGDEYWVSASRPGDPGADGKDGDPVIISQDTTPPFQEDAIWFNTATGEAFFGYLDPSGDEYWVSLSKPGAPGADGKDGDPVIISQDTPPPVVEDHIWFNTETGEAFFGYVDGDGDAYWVALNKPGADGADGPPGKDGDPVVISQDTPPPVTEDYIWFNTSSGEAFFGYVDPSGDAYWVSLSKPGAPGADGKDGDPVIISQDTPPPVVEDNIWFNTDTGEAFFGYVDPSGDAYWVALSKPGAPGADGADGIPVVISQDTAPPVQEDVIWFDTSKGEAFFGYVDPSGDAYWVSLSKPGDPGADGADGTPVVTSSDTPPPVTEDHIWFNTDAGEAFFGYIDPSGDDYWVSLSKPGPPGRDGLDGVTATVSATAPVNPVDGQIWHNSDIGKSYAYWSSQSVWVSM